MNLGVVSVKNDRVVFVTMFFVLLGGISWPTSISAGSKTRNSRSKKR